MAIPEAKKAHLKRVGLTDEMIDELERSLDAKAQEAVIAGLEWKSKPPAGEWDLMTELTARASVEPALLLTKEIQPLTMAELADHQEGCSLAQLVDAFSTEILVMHDQGSLDLRSFTAKLRELEKLAAKV